MRRFGVLLATLCVALTALLTFGSVMVFNPIETKAEEVTYDQVKVYDYLDLTGQESFTATGSATAKQLGAVTETNNYAVRLKVSGWTAAPVHVIFHIGGTGAWGNDGYIFHSEWEYGIYKDRGSTQLAKTTGSAAYNDFNGMSEAIVEFGVKKAYEGETYVGNYVYYKVNDVEKVSVLDASGTEELAGSGIYIPDSALGINFQHMLGLTLSTLKSNIRYDDVKEYDYLDLTGEKSFTIAAGCGVAKQLGTVAEKNNYAIRLKVNGWSSTPVHVILHIGATDEWGNGGYIFHSEWEYGIYKDRGSTALVTTTGSASSNDFAGMNEAIVEFGVKKAYDGGAYIGNYVYCNVNDVNKISYLDTAGTEELAGNGIYIPASTVGGGGGINLEHMIGLTLSTTYSFYQVTIENLPDQIDIEETFTIAVGNQKTDILIPVAEGYILEKVYVNGEDKTDEVLVILPGGYKLSFDSVSGDMIISFVVSEKKWKVLGDESEDYTLEVPENVGHMDNCTVTIRPTVGKLITSVKVNGEEKISACKFDKGVYRLNLYVVTENKIIEVATEDKTFSVTAEVEGSGGSVSVETPTVDAYGTAKVTVELSENYYITAVTMNGEAVSVNEKGEYIVEFVREDIEIKVTIVESKESTSSQEGSSGCSSFMNHPIVLSSVLLSCYLIFKKKGRYLWK